MTFRSLTFTLGITLALGAVGAAQAENRALIMTVSQYSNPRANLEGVAYDNGYAVAIAKKMGFSNITNMQDKQVTKAAMLSALTQLAKTTTAKDKVFIYFSGHGGQTPDRNGDEADGCDEGLWPYDLEMVVDDELDAIFNTFKASEVILMVDSCFSGTITKSLNFNKPIPGAKTWKDVACNQATNTNKGLTRSIGLRREEKPTANKPVPAAGAIPSISEFTAATDRQVALDGTYLGVNGSLFTYAVYQRLVKQTGNPTFNDLRDYAAKYIRSVANTEAHTPQFIGPESTAQRIAAGFAQGSALASTPTPRDMNSFLDLLLSRSTASVELASPQTEYQLNDALSFEVMSQMDGYVNIIEVDPKGQAVLLYPNAETPAGQNALKAGQILRIPEDIGGFEFYGTEPTGKSRVVAFVTSTPLNLYSTQFGSKKDGLLTLDGAKLNALMQVAPTLSALRANPVGTLPYGAGAITINVSR